ARLAAQQLADLRLARSLSASLVAFHLGALLGGRDDLPGAGLEAQAVLAIVEDAQLLAEGELLLARVRSLALAAPHADQRQEREIGRASCRERASMAGGAEAANKKPQERASNRERAQGTRPHSWE